MKKNLLKTILETRERNFPLNFFHQERLANHLFFKPKKMHFTRWITAGVTLLLTLGVISHAVNQKIPAADAADLLEQAGALLENALHQNKVIHLSVESAETQVEAYIQKNRVTWESIEKKEKVNNEVESHFFSYEGPEKTVPAWNSLATRLALSEDQIDTDALRNLSCEDCENAQMLAQVVGEETLNNKATYQITLRYPEEVRKLYENSGDVLLNYVAWVDKESGELVKREIQNDEGEVLLSQWYTFEILEEMPSDLDWGENKEEFPAEWN